MEQVDRNDVTLGADILAGGEREAMVSRMDQLREMAFAAKKSGVGALTIDSAILAYTILCRYLGRMSGELLSKDEEHYLPAVCLNAAAKMESSSCRPLIHIFLQALGVPMPARSTAKVVLCKLEMRVLGKLQYRLMSRTPVTFLHHYLARTVATCALRQAQVASVGIQATENAIRLIKRGLCAHLKPSEIAAISICSAAISQSVSSPTVVAEAMGYTLGNDFIAVQKTEDSEGTSLRHDSSGDSSSSNGSVQDSADDGGHRLSMTLISELWTSYFPQKV